MNDMDRRNFMATASLAWMFPQFAAATVRSEADILFNNFSPSHHVLSVEIARCLSQATGFGFSPRLVPISEARRFSRPIRPRLGRIQTEAMSMFAHSSILADRAALEWLAGEGSAERLLLLEAFIRAGSFRIERTGGFLILTAEV